MTLDRLLSNVVVSVEPFALCLLSTGWRLGLPGPADAMFHFVLHGSGVLREPRGGARRLEPYWLAVVPRGVKHSLECGGDVRSERTIDAAPEAGGIALLVAGSSEPADLRVACGIVHVRYGDSLGLFDHLREVIVADLSGYPQVRVAFEGILSEQGGAAPGSTSLMAAYMNQCLVYLLRHLRPQPDTPLPWLTALENPALARAVDAILDDLAAPHTLESLADEALMSRSTFSERFREAFGCTPMMFLRDVRLRRGALLLRQGGLSIDQIARRIGFSSRSHFTHLFTARFGVSPATYREASFEDGL